MSDNGDSEEDTDTITGVTQSLSNLSISINEESVLEKSNNNETSEPTDDDGYKLMYEATQRKLSAQSENFSQLQTRYNNLKDECKGVTKNEKEKLATLTRLNIDGKSASSSKQCTSDSCTNNVSNEFMLTCTQCKGSQHFVCSGLPDY